MNRLDEIREIIKKVFDIDKTIKVFLDNGFIKTAKEYKLAEEEAIQAIHDSEVERLKPILDVYEKYKDDYENFGYTFPHSGDEMFNVIKSVAEDNK